MRSKTRSLGALSGDAPVKEETPKPPVEMNIRTGDEARLMTLAGTIRAVPVELRMKKTVIKRMWMSSEVPVLQVAKVEIPAIGQSMEVRDFGTAAKGRMVLPGPDEPRIRLDSYDRLLSGKPKTGVNDGSTQLPTP